MPRVYVSHHFKKQLKPYLKKHRSLLDDCFNLLNNFQSYQYIALGEDTYKIRVKSSDMPKGKSKSFRLIILLMQLEDLIVPIAIYFKGDQEAISRREIRYYINVIKQEIDNNFS